jgi:hypothetical protein
LPPITEQAVRDPDVEERRDPLADLVQALDAQSQRHALFGAEQVHRHGIARRGTRLERRALE